MGELYCLVVFPDSASGKESACQCKDAGDEGSISESGRSLEQEMVPQSSILAWKIPWVEESGSLQSMGPQRMTGLGD